MSPMLATNANEAAAVVAAAHHTPLIDDGKIDFVQNESLRSKGKILLLYSSIAK